MEKFLARQPIFDPQRAVFGYELLFRSSLENFYSAVHPDAASTSTADNLFLFGMERLTEGRRAFLNCTHEFLVRDFPLLLPKERVVLEILENIRVDDEVVAACRRFKALGYLIALDDFKEAPEWRPLVALADFIKVDVLATALGEQRRLAREFTGTNVRLIAEKVETYADFERAAQDGYALFQGYFFCRPEILTRHDIPASKLNYLRVLRAANRAEIDQAEVAQRIEEEASLSYRLLRYLNSPAFFLRCEVRSISQALTLLGERGIRKWISLMAIACMGENKPQELVMLPLIRARFCELLGPRAGQGDSANDLFLLGLLSAIDAILDMKMEDVLKEIAVRAEIRDALLGKRNALRDVYDLALKYETGAWEGIDESAARLGITTDGFSESFLSAMSWAKGVLSGHGDEDSEGAPSAAPAIPADRPKRSR